MILEKYALHNLIKEYNCNKDRIDQYFKLRSYEPYREPFSDDSDFSDSSDASILGLSIGVFMLLLIVSLSLWIAAIYLLVKNWDYLENWAKIIGLIGIIFGAVGPIVTIIVVFVGKKSGRKK